MQEQARQGELELPRLKLLIYKQKIFASYFALVKSVAKRLLGRCPKYFL
nr:MAG TPA: hypothetical protein [Bacteriophage sp.]